MISLFFSLKYCVLVLGLVYNLPLLCFASSNATWYKNCGNAFSCGKLSGLGYPFWGGTRPKDCGYPGLELTCRDSNVPVLGIMGHEYQVLGINQNEQTINIQREDLVTSNGLCLKKFVNTTLDFSLFDYTPANINLTILYGCPNVGDAYGNGYESANPTQFACSVNGSNNTNAYIMYGSLGPSVKGCYRSVVIPVMGSLAAEFQAGNLGLEGLIAKGFEVKYTVDSQFCKECSSTYGRCGYDLNENKTICICADGSAGFESCGYNEKTVSSSSNGKGHKSPYVAIGVSIGAVVLLALLGGCLVLARKKRNQLIAQQKTRGIFPTPDSSSNGGPNVPTPGSNGLTSSQAYTSTPSTYSQSMASYGSSASDFGRQKTNYFGVPVFDYAVLEHVTCNFHESKELGDGGFGTVYYGVLPDGRQVAVKRLYENSLKRVEQFMNEIRILANIQHKNLVALYGCTSRSSRELLLVYEYIPNGTVADHLHGKFAETTFLKWPTRLSIAVETAEALAFLHRQDVIHRDVKTANVLLDNDFHVKVADFGLSRLFPSDMTHVSTAPQGTPGYVDPEYYQCYRLTEKSDVYSFGVVLSELISSKHAVDITRHRHDVNLANMAVDRIQNKSLEDLVDPRLGFDKDPTIQAMVKMVAELAFRCLQQDRDMRPTMAEVVASLRAIQLEGVKEQKQEILDIVVYGDDVGLLTNPTPPLSPELPRTNDVV